MEQTLLQKLAEALNGQVHEERERRVKLAETPADIEGVKPTIIKQGVLREVSSGDSITSYARVRMKQKPGEEPKYSLGVKHFGRKEEAETEISKAMFNSFYPDNLDKPQEKDRYELKSGWEIDVIKTGKNKGEVVAEFEHEKGDKVVVPKEWKRK